MKAYSNISQISNLLTLKGLTNQTPVQYKKTANSFFKEFGIFLENAPLIFVKHNCIWKLSHFTNVFKGRVYETATYHPMVGCKDKFKSLSANIKTCWDK